MNDKEIKSYAKILEAMNVAAVVATPKLMPAAPVEPPEPVAMQTCSASGVSTSPPQQALQTAHPPALQGVSSAFVHPQVSTLTWSVSSSLQLQREAPEPPSPEPEPPSPEPEPPSP